MRVHVILDLTPVAKGAVTSEVLWEFEVELEQMPLEVNGLCYDVEVLGLGTTAKAASDSYAARAKQKRQTRQT